LKVLILLTPDEFKERVLPKDLQKTFDEIIKRMVAFDIDESEAKLYVANYLAKSVEAIIEVREEV